MKETFEVLNHMQADGIIGSYAIGGAVGATFYLEPVATLDLDVFVLLSGTAGSALLSLTPIYEYLLPRGHRAEGEYIHIGGWPVQFLPPATALEEEAIAQAREVEVDGISVRVMSAEHLVAIALKVGRAKDYSRILQFIEAGSLDTATLDAILTRHALLAKWEQFGKRFLTDETP
jgi:hypothetical protein